MIPQYDLAEVPNVGKRIFTSVDPNTNHVNFNNPISKLNAVPSTSINANTGQMTGDPSDFGRIISTSNNPRLIQFAFKLNF